MGNDSKEGKKRNRIIATTVVFFVTLLVVALFCVNDYGVTVDEPTQRLTAVQMLMVIIEDITGFTMPSRQIYLMRHCLTFLIVYAGYICLCIALTCLFGGESWVPLIIMMLVSLYPRYFSFQFFDNKNMVFAGFSMITILATVKAVEKESSLSGIWFGLISAVTTNCRVMGIIYPAILLGYYLVHDLEALYDLKKDMSGFGLI